MKLINYFACAICAISMLAACENDNNQPAPQPEEPTPGSYSGTMNVDQNDGTVFTKQEQVISFEVSESGVMDIFLSKVKFAEAMPSLDITIPDVAYTLTDSVYTLADDNIIPMAMGNEFPQFTITGLEGAISAEELTVSFNCGPYPVEYSGTAVTE